MRWSILSFFLLASCSQAVPQRDPEPLERISALDQRISVHATGTFSQLMSVLGKKIDAPLLIHSDWKPGDEPAFTFSIDLDDVRASSALRWLARITNTSVGFQDGAVVFGPEYLVLRPALRSTDVRSLVMEHLDGSGPGIQFSRWNGPGFQLEGERPLVVMLPETETIVDYTPTEYVLGEMLREFAAPMEWTGLYQAQVDPQQRFAVLHQPWVHERIRELIQALTPYADRRLIVTVEIGDAVDGAPVGRPLGPAEASAVEGKLRAQPTCRLDLSAAPGQTARALFRQEATRREAADGTPSPAPYTAELALLESRAFPSRPGTIAADIHLSLGSTEPRTALTLPWGAFTPLESGLTTLRTQLEIPDGGGILLTLPSRASDRGTARHCLIRASAPVSPPLKPVILTPKPPQDEALIGRLRSMAPVDVELVDVRVEVLASWLRQALHVNVVTSVGQPERVTIVARQIEPLKLLNLAFRESRLDWSALDEAVYITTRTDLDRRRTPVAIIPVDDLAESPVSHPGPGSPDANCMTGEDLANLIKNTIRKDKWEEADGRMIWYDWTHRLLMIRNSAEILAETLQYLEESRHKLPPAVSLSARVLSLSPKLSKQELGPWKPGDTVDAATLDRLERAGTVVDRVDWCAMADQVTCPVWERSLEVVERAAISGTPESSMKRTKSWVEVLPRISSDGVEVSVKFGDQRVTSGDPPLVSSASGQGTATLAPGRWWLTMWGDQGRVGILAVRAESVTSRR